MNKIKTQTVKPAVSEKLIAIRVVGWDGTGKGTVMGHVEGNEIAS